VCQGNHFTSSSISINKQFQLSENSLSYLGINNAIIDYHLFVYRVSQFQAITRNVLQYITKRCLHSLAFAMMKFFLGMDFIFTMKNNYFQEFLQQKHTSSHSVVKAAVQKANKKTIIS
jgi:ABC-type uncharacterized transport system permease subunit